MAKLNFDKAHSAVEFSIKHLVISNIKGRFQDFDIQAEGDTNDLSSLKASVVIQANSIDTGVEDRDNHLRTNDFFDIENHPEIKFETTSVSNNEITGNLTIKGQTHEETFDVEFPGVSKNPMNGAQTVGFVVNGKIDREKYGITFNQALETGGVMIGKEVKFEVSAEFAVEE